MMNEGLDEQISIRGDVDIKVYNREGNLLRHDEVRNLVTTAGKEVLAGNLLADRGEDQEKVDSISIGTGVTEATLDDVLMEDQVANEPVRFEMRELNFASFIATFEENVASNETISEIGLYGSKKTLICRTILVTPFVKAPTDYLVINWKLQIG